MFTDFSFAPGIKVKVTPETALNGYHHDRVRVHRYLAVDTIYTLLKAKEGSYHTDIALQEVPGVWFNSVNFVFL